MDWFGVGGDEWVSEWKRWEQGKRERERERERERATHRWANRSAVPKRRGREGEIYVWECEKSVFRVREVHGVIRRI